MITDKRSLKIIIVENDEDELLFMREGFKSAGLFEIVAMAANGDEMLAVLNDPYRPLPDVIISDVNMPGKNGFDILKAVNNNPAFAHIPVIITSTSSSPVMIEKCNDLGACAYLEKPATFNHYDEFARTLYSRIMNNMVK